MESYKKTVKLGTSEIVFETGKVARQATGAVIVSSGETQVLSTVVVGKPPGEHQDFFPLTVNYMERHMLLEKYLEAFSKEKADQRKKKLLLQGLLIGQSDLFLKMTSYMKCK